MKWSDQADRHMGYTADRAFQEYADTPMKSVLVVDDNELVRNLIETVLKNAGLDVVTAASGPDAIRLLEKRSDSIACVLQDLSLPSMPGEQVVSELHKIKPGLPVIILTVDDAAYNASRLAGLSLSGYIQKPFDANVLVAKVTALIEADLD
jgi:CheY-like chemotaxis protein